MHPEVNQWVFFAADQVVIVAWLNDEDVPRLNGFAFAINLDPALALDEAKHFAVGVGVRPSLVMGDKTGAMKG